jgi:subtilisin family serine protease
MAPAPPCARRPARILAAAILAAVLALPAGAGAAPSRPRARLAAAPGQLVVGVRSAAAARRLERLGGRRLPGLSAVRVPAGAAAAHTAAAVPGVSYVEPNYLYRAQALPSDPMLDEQWALLGANGVDAPAAWDQVTGGTATVALIDSGVDTSHPELAGNLWTNPGEIPGNGIDDDHDGYVDDVHGWSFVSDSGDVADDNGHGTAVAGIVAARGDNRVGVAGMTWRAQLMPLKVLDADGAGTADDVALAIRFALAHGARIINASVSGPGRSQVLEDAIRDARDAGATVVTAAGNQGKDLDASPAYPAAYPEDNVIAVGSEGENGNLSDFSNRGRLLDLVAPGEDVLTTARDDQYARAWGTSMAAPFASGALALLQAARPDLPEPALAAALIAGARPANASGGAPRLDAAGALRQVIPSSGWHSVAAPKSAEPGRPRLSGPTGRRTVRVGRVLFRWRAPRGGSAVAAYQVLLDGRPVARMAVRARAAATRLRVRVGAGAHRWQVVALDAAGHSRASRTGRFRARPRGHRRHA